MKFTGIPIAAAFVFLMAFVPTFHAHSLESLNFKQLTSENYQSYIQDARNLLVLFSVEWCQGCRSIRKDWKAIGELLKDELITVAVDGDGEAYLKALYNIEVFPMVLLIDKKQQKYYEFDFEKSKDLVTWASYGYSKSPAMPVPTSVNILFYIEMLMTSWYTRNPQSYYFVLGGCVTAVILFRFLRKPKKIPTQSKVNEKKDLKSE